MEQCLYALGGPGFSERLAEIADLFRGKGLVEDATPPANKALRF